MLSSQGGSATTQSSIVVKYTIGQQSVTGSTTGTYTVQQGFQQSNWNKIIEQNNSVSISTTTFPIPFKDLINFTFSGNVGETLSIQIFDVSGRIVFNDVLQVVAQTTALDLKHLPSATYFVKLSNPTYLYYTKIIKNE
jgi:ACT domain-containing protein